MRITAKKVFGAGKVANLQDIRVKILCLLASGGGESSGGEGVYTNE
jgi:hypothetical protein